MSGHSLGTPAQLRDPDHTPPLLKAIPLGIQQPRIFITAIPDSDDLIRSGGRETAHRAVYVLCVHPHYDSAGRGQGRGRVGRVVWRDHRGGIFHGILGLFVGKIRFTLPPLLTGLAVTMISLALVKVGIQYAAGGVPAVGTAEYGSLLNCSAALIVIFVTLGLKFFARRMLSISAVLVGMLSFEAIGQSWTRAAAFALPDPFRYGFEFSAVGIIGFCLMAFISASETVGDVSGITKGGAGREATDAEIAGTTYADGIGSAIAGIFGGMPNHPHRFDRGFGRRCDRDVWHGRSAGHFDAV